MPSSRNSTARRKNCRSISIASSRCARPGRCCIATAREDTWANPAGQFEMAVAADPVYQLYGVKGLGTRQMPGIGQLTGDRLAYHIREGKHAMSAPDWRVFLDFATRQWGQQ